MTHKILSPRSKHVCPCGRKALIMTKLPRQIPQCAFHAVEIFIREERMDAWFAEWKKNDRR